MNLKVLTAVFITLFGISVGMSQGAFSVDDFTNVSNLTDGIGDTIGGLFERTGDRSDGGDGTTTVEGNKSFAGTFSTSSAVKMQLSTPVGVSFAGQAQVSIGGLQTDATSASLSNFTGDVELAANKSVDGAVDAITVDDSSFSADDRQDVSMDISTLDELAVEEFVTDSVTFQNVTGSFETEAGTFEYDDEQTLEITSFSGEIIIRENEIELDGLVASASIGDTTIGG